MGQRILSIDDNEIVGWTLAARLWVAGYDVDSVSSAAAGFDALRDRQYDLVLIDLEMPDCNGLDALSIIRREGFCPDVPVVILTTSEDFGHVQQAYTLGAKGYLTKGFASTKLIKHVDRLMNGRDVVWIDDFHCVSTQAMEAASLSRPSVSQPDDIGAEVRPANQTRLTLVADSGARMPQTIGVC